MRREVSSAAPSHDPWSFSFLSKTRAGFPRQRIFQGFYGFPEVELFLGIVPGIPAMPLPSLSTLSGPVCSLQISVTFTFLSLSVLLKDFSSLGFVNVLGCVRSVQVVNKCSSPAIKLRRNSLLTFPGGAILSPLVLTFVALHSFSCTLNRILGVYCDTAAFYFF